MRTIAIIGAGTIGGILARKLSALGHTVRIANSKAPSTLAAFAGGRITPAWAVDAPSGADVAILSLPQAAVARLSDELLTALRRVPIVVDTGNYYPARDGRIELIDDGLSDSEWVAAQLGRPVFKAFNSIGGMSLLTKGNDDGTAAVALPVAGAPGADKLLVMDLVGQLGFDAVDGGELRDSWRQQPGTPVYCTDLSAENVRHHLGQARAGDIAGHRANRDAQDPVGGSAKQHRAIIDGQLRESK